MSGLQHNAPEVAARLQLAQQRIRAELEGTLAGLAGRVAARMRIVAPKWRSTLTNSVREERRGPLAIVVRPTVDYALYVEKGRKPGKGLPRFFDPAAASIVAWLEGRQIAARQAASGGKPWRRGRAGSNRRRTEELELRDAYMALSRHVKFRGIKAHPFVKPTADEFREQVRAELVAAVRRGAAAAGLQLRGGGA